MTSTSATPAGSHQDLGRGAAGTALARIAAARLTGLPPRATASWVRAMTAGPVTANASASLFYGAPAVAFVLHTGAHPAYAAMLAALDEHVNDLTALKLAAAYERIDRGELTRPGEYDLISGLTGLGVYHLVRHGPAGSGMTAAVLGYLVALAEPVCRHGESLPGWWSGTGPAGTPDPAWPGGHLNLGMAHGIAGILALLSGAMRVGIQVDGQAKAVSELCATFDRYRQGSTACPWWPAMITLGEHKRGRANSGRQARPSWCYGTPGQARAQQLAGLALGDQERMRAAERALAGCVLDRQVTGLLDRRLAVPRVGRPGPGALAGRRRRPRPRAAPGRAARGTPGHGRPPRPRRPASLQRAPGRNIRHPARPERPAPRGRRTARMGRLPAADPVNPDPVKEKR